MQRRTYLKSMLAATAASPVLAAETTAHPIQLHVDLTVDPAKEKEMLNTFHKTFRPAASKMTGFIDAKILKLRSTLAGSAPQGVNYRFVLIFQTEELRQKWVASAIHQKVWPMMESTLKHKNYNVILFDVA